MDNNKHGGKEKEIAYRILKIAGLGVLFAAVSILSPTFPYLILRAYLKKAFKKNYKSSQIKNSVNYLKRRQFIAYRNKKFVLTKLGRKYLGRKALNDLQIKRLPWDRKWRVVTFDIPQQKIAARHVFRDHLKRMGFFHFQRSVFIIPYPCEKEIDQLTENLGVEECVHILTSDRFRNDDELVKRFKI